MKYSSLQFEFARNILLHLFLSRKDYEEREHLRLTCNSYKRNFSFILVRFMKMLKLRQGHLFAHVPTGL